jgi:hypothetical protein
MIYQFKYIIMKKYVMSVAGYFIFLLMNSSDLYSQQDKNKLDFNVGADFYSSYVYRGTRFGQGPSVQPVLKLTYAGLTAGVWGAYDFSGYCETDPYISYNFPFGLALGLTDYHYPPLNAFDVSDSTGTHALEANTSFTKWGLSLSANYVFNEAGGAGSEGKDIYLQAGYNFGMFNILIGAGNGWYTSDTEFGLCNLAIGVTKSITVTEKFSIPVNGQVILNPDRKQLFLIVGFTF